MVKIHNVRLIVDGRPADSYNWPKTVENGEKLDILCYGRDWAVAGCSGYVVYKMNDTEITFAFSNPSVGTNKLGVGTSGRDVWDNMTSNNYAPFNHSIKVGKILLKFECKCTGEKLNLATVKIERYI